MMLPFDVAVGKQNLLFIKVIGLKLKRKSKKWAGYSGPYVGNPIFPRATMKPEVVLYQESNQWPQI